MQNASLHDEVTNQSDFVERSAFSFLILRLRDDMTYSLVHPLFFGSPSFFGLQKKSACHREIYSIARKQKIEILAIYDQK